MELLALVGGRRSSRKHFRTKKSTGIVWQKSRMRCAASSQQPRLTNGPRRSRAKLKKLDEDGLLEAYVLMALPDQGIAQDHPAFLKQHRDKLRRYAMECVVKGGGN